MKAYRFLIVLGILVIAASIALGVAAQEPPAEDPHGDPPTFLADIWEVWAQSPHADAEAEAFNHWNEDGEVEVDCARCHSTAGYADFLGADGSAAGSVEVAPAVGSVINCDACHNSVARTLTSVTFPSGVELTDLNDAARCMNCHQGRASSATVTSALENAGVMDDLNAVSEDLRFINIHYYAAAATLYGSEVMGGYQFDGMTYQSRFRHVEGIDTCIDCHDPHSLEIQVEKCSGCHEGVETVEDLYAVRMPGSGIDYDGDGDVEEGIKDEISTLQDTLYTAIQMYAANIIGTPIVYDQARYPYFFADANGNGAIDEGEGGYASFTGRLVQATYNFQVTKKDPGNFAHNAKYHIELLVDSINVLNEELGGALDVAQINRDDPGHFNTTREAFRHWDEAGEVDAGCAKCHSADGLPFFIKNDGVSIAQPVSDSLHCTTCHSSMGDEFAVYTLNEVTFPSGFSVSFGEEDPNNICLNCHQGRESTVSVNSRISAAGVGDDEVSDALRFTNPHYFAAGATKFGSEAMGGYQYEGKEYTGLFEHNRRFSTCTDCHDQHTLEPRVEDCADCHENVETKDDIFLIRVDDDYDPVDYDGDGNVEEPIRDEITALHDVLFATIQDYAANTVGTAIAYNPAAYPYWYADANGNGAVDEGEEAFAQWTPNLIRGVYNYLFVAKDPGSFAHNADYSLQLLYDSIESLGGDVSSFNRPPIYED